MLALLSAETAHYCVTLMNELLVPRPDLQATPLENADLIWLIDSSYLNMTQGHVRLVTVLFPDRNH